MGCAQSRLGKKVGDAIDDRKWPRGKVVRTSSLTFRGLNGRTLVVELACSVANSELAIRTEYGVCALSTTINGSGVALSCTDLYTVARAPEGAALGEQEAHRRAHANARPLRHRHV